MRSVVQLAVIIGACLGGSALAQVPSLPDIPDGLPAEAAGMLEAKRAPLGTQRKNLLDEVARHNARCTSVRADTPEARDCAVTREPLLARIRQLRIAADKLEEEIDNAMLNAQRNTTPFKLTAVESRGEFYVLTVDGRKLSGQNAAQVVFDGRTTAVTGPTGYARLTLPDDTTFTMPANSSIVLDDFVYDPNVSARKLSVRLVIGGFRWVTGMVNSAANAIRPHIDMVAFAVGIRGTDFEAFITADGSGYVKLFSGSVVLTPKDGTAEITLNPGQMVTYRDGKITGPVAIPDNV
jgi:ferric-dicitrate binding protein FerR (iron transport regulator)